MQLQETKFIIEKISAEQKTRSEKKYVELLLKKNAPTDEFGDPIGKDDLFKVLVWEKQFDKLNGFAVGDKVLAQLYMNGVEQLDQNSKVYYAVNFTLKALKQYEPTKN